ncbi:MAG TPA: ATP-binding protein, partial [Anaerolineae bacterium]|nr:ATP-binding protein [Anaerolineae bacterium]
FLMQQNYRGWLGGTLRKPVVAGVATAMAALFPTGFAVYAAAPGDGWTALDYTESLFVAATLPLLAEILLGALLTHLACLAFPSLRPSLPAAETPIYARSFGRRVLLTILPITFVTICFQVFFVGATALGEARQQALAQLTRSAQTAAELLDSFFIDGQAVLSQVAADDRLRSEVSLVRQAKLQSAISTLAFFDELLLVAPERSVTHWVRVGVLNSAQPPGLTSDEAVLVDRALASGAPLRTGVHRDSDGAGMISFVQPIGAGADRPGALIGRTRLSVNPLINLVKRNLRETQDLGVGYLIDENNRIIVHPNPELELSQWVFDQGQPPYATNDSGGRVYIDPLPDNRRRFIFVQEVSGTPWTVAIELPYSNILRTAARISAPLVVMFAVIMIGALILLPLISRGVTRPLGALAQAARRIAGGALDRPVAHSGEDEVGQLGAAFERMRQSLKARVDDLSLLLRVSEAVSASLDLERGIPQILAGAMQVSAQDTRPLPVDASQDGERSAFAPARVARLIVYGEEGQPARVIAQGDGPGGLTALDTALAAMASRDERPLLIENVARSRGAVDPNVVGPGVRSIAAVALRGHNRILGALWLGYPEPRMFPESETNLLVTLAGQAAVFIENARLFEATEEGRRQLQAVLSSTADAVLVTDHENRILLCNPAAESAFGVPPGSAVNCPVSRVISDAAVIELLTAPFEAEARTAEVALPNGRTLYGSASSIVAGDGQRIGRVAVLRDITHLKELDAMKSEFVATVSHDLRAPLTYMRGYVTMIPMISEVTAKQQDYLNKISIGIEQMTALIDDLLDLGRIEAGVGLVREPVSLSNLVRETVESLQGNALMRKQTLRLDRLAEGTLQGDTRFLKRAIANLIDNAIKYTPEGGEIRVGVDERDGQMVVHVTDTGMGIAPADQVRLFEKFYRVKRRDTLEIKGTGLGLAIVKSVAERHEGRAWVESQLGRGSTFYLALPIAKHLPPATS